jgi:hypothetical protein
VDGHRFLPLPSVNQNNSETPFRNSAGYFIRVGSKCLPDSFLRPESVAACSPDPYGRARVWGLAGVQFGRGVIRGVKLNIAVSKK